MFKECNISKSADSKLLYTNIKNMLYSVVRKGEKRCKLYTCKAEVWEYDGLLVLVSYSTPVAMYLPDNATIYDCLRPIFGYTATSAQHIAKFSKWLAEDNYNVKYSVRFKN